MAAAAATCGVVLEARKRAAYLVAAACGAEFVYELDGSTYGVNFDSDRPAFIPGRLVVGPDLPPDVGVAAAGAHSATINTLGYFGQREIYARGFPPELAMNASYDAFNVTNDRFAAAAGGQPPA